MNSTSHKVIMSDDDYDRLEWQGMEFVLTYSGPLKATQRDAREGQAVRHKENKREIRKVLHAQLKKLWEVVPSLHERPRSNQRFVVRGGMGEANTIKTLSRQHQHYGYQFVPLVTQDLELLCSLDILMLRPDRPGATIWAGDIDNRLKTLIDAMRIPEAGEDYSTSDPAPEENPFFVLLEDDKMLNKVSLETDRLLEDVNGKIDDVRLFIRVNIKPYDVKPSNMHFT